MRQAYRILFFSLLLIVATTLCANDTSFTAANLTVTWSQTDRAFTIRGTLADGTTRDLVVCSKPRATYKNNEGIESGDLTSDAYQQVSYETHPLEDLFGSGTEHIFTFSNPAGDGDDVVMQQSFFAYDEQPFLLTRLALVCRSGIISSNHLEPICCEGNTWSFLSTTAGNNRMLQVPFDNNEFVRYHTYRLSRSMTSYEVSALFDGASRCGAVFGSVDHDHWKSGISIEAVSGTSVQKLQLISGIADKQTRDDISGYDHQPHGALQGETVSSARFLIGFFDDWRTGMETFADACATIRPARHYWTHGAPFGWQSWGVMSDKNSYEADVEICDYFAEVLQPGGFCSEDGNVVISLDASSNVNDTQRKRLVTTGRKKQQLIGCYTTPLALWWDEESINNYEVTWTESGRQKKAKMRETLIKINGKPVKYNGAYCRDPTHPVTKQDIYNTVISCSSDGIKWIKADFLNNGIVQSDSYYDTKIRTAVEAYNSAMKYFCDLCERRGIFLNLSIAPLFPHGHANGRRIACDTWARIDQTEYAMNAISGGWWTDRLYQFNDPDHIVLVGNGDQASASLGENRARVTSGAVTGMMLVADNFSPSDQSGRGNNTLSRKRAEQCLLNADVNAVARLGRSFRPLYGHKEYDLNADHAQNLFTLRTDSCIYLAAFNYTGNQQTFIVPLQDLGITDENQVQDIMELWMHRDMRISSGRISVIVSAKDARLVRIRLIGAGDAVPGIPKHPTAVIQTENFDLLGRQVPANSQSPFLLRRTTYTDGTVQTQKIRN